MGHAALRYRSASIAGRELRSRLVLATLGAAALLCGLSRTASAGAIDGVGASDLFAQHAYVQTGTGIYYATENPGGFTLNYASGGGVATVFQALTTGLRPYSPCAPGIPGHGWPGTASAEVGTFGLAGGSDGQGGSNACGAGCGAWGGTPAPSTTQDAAAGSDAGAPTTHDGVSHSPGPGSSGSYGFRGGFFASSGSAFATVAISERALSRRRRARIRFWHPCTFRAGGPPDNLEVPAFGAATRQRREATTRTEAIDEQSIF